MRSFPPSIQKLIREFNKLPGIGSKTSERFVFHLLKQEKSEIESFAKSLLELKKSIQLCTECFTVSEDSLCSICGDKQRERKIICVVAEPKDVMAFEKTGEFDGVYHVLGGTINHFDGTGPEQIRIKELIDRIDNNGVEEIILATNPDMEGETTASYIAKLLNSKPITITRIAQGLPIGADIEFADEVTLGNSLNSRRQINIKDK